MSQPLDLYPRLVVRDADTALDFYTAVLDGTVAERHTAPDGSVVHAVVEAGPVRFAVKDADEHDPAPGSDGLPVILALHVPDADATAARMTERGATVIFPVRDQPYGQRSGRLRDPFGHRWMVAQPHNNNAQLTPRE